MYSSNKKEMPNRDWFDHKQAGKIQKHTFTSNRKL